MRLGRRDGKLMDQRSHADERSCGDIVDQLGVLLRERPALFRLGGGQAHSKRGIDFYSFSELVAVLRDAAALFRSVNGYQPSIVDPRRFNERIFHRFFFAEHRMPSLSNKLAARDYVRTLVGDEVLTKVVWVGRSLDDLFAADLPPGRYFLKANHGSGLNLALNVPSDIHSHQAEIRQIAAHWTTARFNYDLGEWQYSTFEPLLFLEKNVDINDGAPLAHDYKLYCFNGEVRCVSVVTGRSHTPGVKPFWSMYDPAWNRVPIERLDFTPHESAVPRPENLSEIMSLASRLSRAFDFVSVDLYSNGVDRIIFGEFTFTPSGSRAPFSSRAADDYLGGFFDELAPPA
jgi:hypothetical protein